MMSINGAISNQAAMNTNYEIEQQSETSTNVLQFIQKKVAKKTFNIGKVLIVDEEKFNWGIIEGFMMILGFNQTQ